MLLEISNGWWEWESRLTDVAASDIHVDAFAPVVVVVQHVDGGSGLGFPEVKSWSQVVSYTRRSWMDLPRLFVPTTGNGPGSSEGYHEVKEMHRASECCICSLGLIESWSAFRRLMDCWLVRKSVACVKSLSKYYKIVSESTYEVMLKQSRATYGYLYIWMV